MKSITKAESLPGEWAVQITHWAPSLGVWHWEGEPTSLVPGLVGLTAGLGKPACKKHAQTHLIPTQGREGEVRLQGGWLVSHNHPGLHFNLRRVVTYDTPPHWAKGHDTSTLWQSNKGQRLRPKAATEQRRGNHSWCSHKQCLEVIQVPAQARPP